MRQERREEQCWALCFLGGLKARRVERVTVGLRSMHVRHRSFANRDVSPCKFRLIRTWMLQG